MRWCLSLQRRQGSIHLYGMTRAHAQQLSEALAVTQAAARAHAREQRAAASALAEAQRAEAAAREVKSARRRVAKVLARALRWQADVLHVITGAEEDARWITTETLAQLMASRPRFDSTLLEGSAGSVLRAALSIEEIAALEFLDVDLVDWVSEVNELVIERELTERKPFFDNIETSPLTEEQARAVICFDNRVQLIAAAGSGKTSVMVARAAYAIERGFVAADRILLLAFNRAAAEELQERLDARLRAIGLPSTGLRAATFHAFGLSVIAKATGRKPRPAPWLDGGQDVAMVGRLVDELRDSSANFRFRWDLLRLLYARVSDDPAGGEPDHWDRQKRVSGFRTANDETVKSEGERILADWLYYNGVDYRYEAPYVVDVADEDHSQYRPDFYYPQIDVWHEHWALGTNGKPPKKFKNYAQSMRWKKKIHRTHGTTLVETTWAEIIDY